MAENNPESQPQERVKHRSKYDRYVYAGFIIALIVGVVLIYLHQLDPANLGWGDEHEVVLKQGIEQNRPVILLFKTSPSCEDTKRLQKMIIKKGMAALKKHNYLTSFVPVSVGLKDTLAVEYKIEKLPTILVFSPDGTEVAREEGYIGDGTLVKLLAAGAKDKKSAR